MRSRRSPRRTGFTLMEVLLVLAILVIIGSLAGVAYVQVQKNSYSDAAKAQMQIFKQLLDNYRLDVGSYPADLDGLVNLPSDIKRPDKWRGPYMKAVPEDPWGNLYIYEPNGETFTIRSAGSDGAPNTNDDIVVQ